MTSTRLILLGIVALTLISGLVVFATIHSPSTANAPVESPTTPTTPTTPETTRAAKELSSSSLRERVTPEGILEHEPRFATIADENGGDRAAGTPGYEASADYVAQTLRKAGYEVELQKVELPQSEGGGTTSNVIATSISGDSKNTVMLGAHLDSAPNSPGINDNGSGSATILEIAEEIAELDEEPRNRLRFAFWGGEEIGLLGSRHYVRELDANKLDEISVYLNFDMIASTNYVPMLYGSQQVTQIFESYFESQDLETDTFDLSGRSDHGPFARVGVPVGGIFSGDSTIKTAEQAEIFGGQPGEPYDSCYHRACDDLNNLNREALDEISGAAAHATATFAQSTASLQR